MKKAYVAVVKKADALFQAASFISHIENKAEYEQSLELMNGLMEDYEHNQLLIKVLSDSIARWEDSAQEFARFNKRVANIKASEALLQILMEQHELGVADLPEIGSKSLVSKILHGERRLTRDHIEALSKRFGISPALFF